MSDVLHRLVAAFVAPVERGDGGPGAWVEPAPPSPPSVAVLAAPDRAVAIGAAVALALGGGPVLTGIWGAEPQGPRAAASPRAGRLAGKLTARGHDAAATGRLVVVTLGDGADEAARVAAAAQVPSVLVVAGPRDARVDRVVAAQDRVLVAGDDLVAALALDSVRALGVRAHALALPGAVAARVLAASGVALVAPWRAPVLEALG